MKIAIKLEEYTYRSGEVPHFIVNFTPECRVDKLLLEHRLFKDGTRFEIPKDFDKHYPGNTNLGTGVTDATWGDYTILAHRYDGIYRRSDTYDYDTINLHDNQGVSQYYTTFRSSGIEKLTNHQYMVFCICLTKTSYNKGNRDELISLFADAERLDKIECILDA
jgi:hypothetical protein